MQRIIASTIAILALVAAPSLSHADYCSAKGSLDIRSIPASGDIGNNGYWTDLGQVGCGQSPLNGTPKARASIADTNFLSPEAGSFEVFAWTPKVNDDTLKPKNGTYQIDSGPIRSLFFTYDGSTWRSQEVSIPPSMAKVVAKACVFPDNFEVGCKNWTITYEKL